MAVFKYKGLDFNYEIHGEGKPLLILNGIMMSCMSWYPLLPNLKENNKVILVDMLNQGKSAHVNFDFTQDYQVELIKALLDELELKKVSICGISYGGEVALRFAVKHQEYIERLVLSNTLAYTNSWLGDIGKAWNLVAASGNGEAYYYTTIPVIYSPEFYTSRSEWMENRRKILVPLFSDPNFYNAMIGLTKSADDHNVCDKLNTITVPTLIIGCDQDYLTPFPEQQYIHDNIKGSKLVRIEHSGHASMYEQPLVWTSLVTGFVNSKDVEFKI